MTTIETVLSELAKGNPVQFYSDDSDTLQTVLLRAAEVKASVFPDEGETRDGILSVILIPQNPTDERLRDLIMRLTSAPTAPDDPIFKLLGEHKAAVQDRWAPVEFDPEFEPSQEASDREREALYNLPDGTPTTLAGAAALLERYSRPTYVDTPGQEGGEPPLLADFGHEPEWAQAVGEQLGRIAALLRSAA